VETGLTIDNLQFYFTTKRGHIKKMYAQKNKEDVKMEKTKIKLMHDMLRYLPKDIQEF
jgi:hypothetical protein